MIINFRLPMRAPLRSITVTLTSIRYLDWRNAGGKDRDEGRRHASGLALKTSYKGVDAAVTTLPCYAEHELRMKPAGLVASSTLLEGKRPGRLHSQKHQPQCATPCRLSLQPRRNNPYRLSNLVHPPFHSLCSLSQLSTIPQTLLGSISAKTQCRHI